MTSLVQSGSNCLLGNGGPILQSGGAAVSAGQFAGWTPVGAEATAGGYMVAWYNAGANAYTFWQTDSSGVLLFNSAGPVAVGDPLVQSFESIFRQDLSGDGVIAPPTVIEGFGATDPSQSGCNYL